MNERGAPTEGPLERLWAVARAAIADLPEGESIFDKGSRCAATWELDSAIRASRYPLPSRTTKEKAARQERIANAARRLIRECKSDPYCSDLDLRELCAVSTLSDRTRRQHRSKIAQTMARLGQGRTGVQLIDLLEGLATGLEMSADELNRIFDTGDNEPEYEFFKDFDEGEQHRITKALADSPRQPPPTWLNGGYTSFCFQGVAHLLPLYGSLETLHAPYALSKIRDPHLQTAIEIMRWMREYTGESKETAVKDAVDALLGPALRNDGSGEERDYIRQAKRASKVD